MLTIYGVYRSRASRNYWLAGELGIPFKSEPIMQAYRLADPNAKDAPPHTRTAAFLEVNPNGHIPSMDDDGLKLHESLAINLYIAKKHGGPLAPAGLAEDALMTMWSLWAANELETNALQVLTHRAGKVELRDPKLAQVAIDALRAPFGVLDKALADTGFLVGGRFSVADINVAEVVRYAMAAPELFSAVPRVKAWLEACHARPAFKAMMAKREQEPA